MVLPVALLQAAEGNPVLIELKDGTTFNGTLINTDSFMNANLKDVTCTSKEGTKFWKLAECYIRGVTIKYFRMSEEILEALPAENTPHEFKPRIRGTSSYRGGSSSSFRGVTASRGGSRGGGSEQRGRGGGDNRGRGRGGSRGGASSGRGTTFSRGRGGTE